MLKKFFALILISSIFSLSAFEQADLAQLKNPKQISFKKLDLCGADLSKVNLSNRRFESVEFNGAHFGKNSFENSVFISCNFVDTFLQEVLILDTIFISCIVDKAYMTKQAFPFATFARFTKKKKESRGIIFVD